MLNKKKPLVLMILDGFGIGKKYAGNAIDLAKTPVLDNLFATCPTTEIEASGAAVGLPVGQMGNSEVGHTNIGAGRVVYQDLARISNAIDDGSFFNNETLLRAIENCKKNNTALHLMGLLSDGGVHSHLSHLFALVKMAKLNGLSQVFVHAFTDGRDVLPTSGVNYVKICEKELKKIGVGKIVTVSGRYYAMDRDNRWARVKKAYDAIVNGQGHKALSATQVLGESYKSNVTDEFVEPAICGDYAGINENDSVVFFNFRPDRARELTKSIIFEWFDGFERSRGWFKTFFVALTQYDESFQNCAVAFKPTDLSNTFGEYISKQGLTQLRIAETEKYAHVTFFFNGGREQPFENEKRVLIKSPSVATYDLKPEMSAFEVTQAVVENIKSGLFDVVILNYANCDMVGHTGVLAAAIKAVEAVDSCVGEVLNVVKSQNGVVIVTADHGNAEKMLDDEGAVFTAHTTNLVKFSVAGFDCKLKSGGKLCDIAPTMLTILGLKQPIEMTGSSLIEQE